jgi:hypothetical protein
MVLQAVEQFVLCTDRSPKRGSDQKSGGSCTFAIEPKTELFFFAHSTIRGRVCATLIPAGLQFELNYQPLIASQLQWCFNKFSFPVEIS